MQAQIVVQPLRAQHQDRPLQQLQGETELKQSQHSPCSKAPGTREEQTHLLALCDSADGALGITLAAWREGDEQESQSAPEKKPDEGQYLPHQRTSGGIRGAGNWSSRG